MNEPSYAWHAVRVGVITRRFEFDAGHRLMNHEGKCRFLHGHRYRADVTVTGKLDDIGRVVDFSRLKEIVSAFIDTKWDHKFICRSDDPILQVWLGHSSEEQLYIMGRNPTAENLVEELWKNIQTPIATEGLDLQHIRLYETPNCWADYGTDQIEVG